MKKLNQILQFIVLAYFGTFLVFFMGFGTLGPIFGMEKATPEIISNILLIGGCILLVHWGTGALMVKGIKDTLTQKEQEMVNLKARLYDLKHPKFTEQKKPELSQPKSENPPSDLPTETQL